MADILSILSHASLPLAKTWKADGSIAAYAMARTFALRKISVASIEELSRLLTILEKEPKMCLIRGKYIGSTEGAVFRRLTEFEDQPLHSVLIEVDNYEPLLCDPVLDPESAAHEYIRFCLPPEFQGASFHWQLSNSAGSTKNKDKLKAHLWFWLEAPWTSAQLKAWALKTSVPCDIAVFSPVQIHYTSAPVFEHGAVDPVPCRSGFFNGVRAFVPLGAAVEIISPSEAHKKKILGQHLQMIDPNVEFLQVIGEGNNGELHIVCPFELFHSMESSPSSTVYFPAGTNNFEQGHFKCLHSSCAGRTDTDFLDMVGARKADFREIIAEVPTIDAVNEETPIFFERNNKGRIIANMNNFKRALSRPSFCKRIIRFDNFKGDVVISPVGNTKDVRPIRDVDITQLRLVLEEQGFEVVPREMVRDVIDVVAQENVFDSAQDWVLSLQWDGIERINEFLPVYFNVRNSAYAVAVSRYFWTAVAGRVLSPGCQADMVPVFISEQGTGKSSGLEQLVPSAEFYTTIDLTARDSDLARKMRGKIIVEIAELRGLQSKEQEAIRDFITRRREEWVPKFREFTTAFPRRNVFVAAGNNVEFLADNTGNRRWLPVDCGKVNVDALAQDRLQLWAEAVALYKTNGLLWAAAQHAANSKHSRYRCGDTWEDAIRNWLDTVADLNSGETFGDSLLLQTSDVARMALSMEIRNLKRGDEMRIASIMRYLGYDRTERGGMRVWVKKAKMEEAE